MTIEELRARQEEIRGRLQEIDAAHAGEYLDPESDDGQEWSRLNDELEENVRTVDQLETRQQRLEAIAENDSNREEPQTFQTRRSGVARGDDIYNLAEVRASISNPEEATEELRSRALRSIETSTYPDSTHRFSPSREDRQTHVQRLLESGRDDGDQTMPSRLARHILVTGSPAYRRAFPKAVAQLAGYTGMMFTPEEQRAMSLANAGGGFAVPYTLDPTIIPTSNLSVNPFRAISNVEQIPGDEWRGVSSAGVTAAYAAEATESSDNSPTIAQPVISTEKAQVFIPYSIEIGMDWGSFQTEMARLIQDAKDDLEATKFATGSGTNEPFGLLTGATTVVTTAGTAAFALADLYSLEQALGPRFRARASVVANRAQLNRVRAFDTSGGAGIWVPNLTVGPFANDGATSARVSADVLGYPTYELSSMASVLTTGSLIGVIGDFRYFKIVDRIGMTLENIPHLFGAANRYPTGQRGLYGYWRNGSKVLDANAFRVLKTL